MAGSSVEIVYHPEQFRALAEEDAVIREQERTALYLKKAIAARIHDVSRRSRANLRTRRVRRAGSTSVDISTIWYFKFPDQGTKFQVAQHIIENAIDDVRRAL
jgi:hypothetical protein